MNHHRALSNAEISVIAFDLNETLVKWKEAFDESFKSAISDWVGRWSEKDRAEAAAEALKRYYIERERTIKKQSGASLVSERKAWLKQAVNELPLSHTEASIDALMNRIMKQQPSYARMSKGTKETLASLSKSYRLAIISDTNRDTALQIVSAAGLTKYIPEDQLFTPAASGKRKPDASRFEAVNRKMKTPPSRCLMVGDSLRRDVSGAVNAGWNAVWLKPGEKKPAARRLLGGKPVIQIASVTDLPDLLR